MSSYINVNASLLDWKFVALLAVVGVLRAIVPQRFYILFGVTSSAALVGLAAPQTLLVIGGVTLFYVYPLHRLMLAARERGYSETVSKWLLGLGIAGLVALLMGFKLYKQFSVPWLAGPWLAPGVLALVGFSYFIFRAISFLHIQAILKMDERRPWVLLWYTLFPPTITSGPIQKYQDFRQQTAAPLPLDRSVVLAAVYRVTRGYFRKVVVAFVLNEAVTRVLAAGQLTIITSIAATFLLYLYFYFDFAGYSDIAIGFGLLMGIKVPENFRKPFLATTVSEFWRNWHITLVDWFRDHVFIPLGGMQVSRAKAAALALMVMVLCGLWHGLTFALLAWGTWHGLLLLSEGLSGSRPVPPALRQGVNYWSRVLWTNARVAFGCIFFLPGSEAMFKVFRGFVSW
jgi:alginate O-acetyltransferase complex protein AlgI